MPIQEGRFVWFELMTTDLDAAERFYGAVAGWSLKDSGMSGVRYTLASVGPSRIGGLMVLPDHVRAHGGRPGWTGYVGVADVDAMAERVREAGGAVHRAPDDIPGVGRFSVVADPQGAAFVLFRGDGPAPEAPAPGTPGFMGWHELHAGDWEAVFPFYADLFGWEKSTPVDMGPMGTYQLFAGSGADIGGMFTDRQSGPPHWLYYITVSNIDAAVIRVTEAGGRVLQGPHPVPGGSYIIHATDPQDATFALVGPRAAA